MILKYLQMQPRNNVSLKFVDCCGFGGQGCVFRVYLDDEFVCLKSFKDAEAFMREMRMLIAA